LVKSRKLERREYLIFLTVERGEGKRQIHGGGQNGKSLFYARKYNILKITNVIIRSDDGWRF